MPMLKGLLRRLVQLERDFFEYEQNPFFGGWLGLRFGLGLGLGFRFGCGLDRDFFFVVIEHVADVIDGFIEPVDDFDQEEYGGGGDAKVDDDIEKVADVDGGDFGRISAEVQPSEGDDPMGEVEPAGELADGAA